MSTETSASNSKSGVYQKIESFATFGINTVHAKLTEVTEVAKTRFPIAAGPIDYVSETAAVGAATVLKYYDGGALLATVTLSKVSDMATDKTKAVKPIVDKLGQTYQSSLTIVESTANNAVSKVKGAVDNGKVYILNIFDRVFVFASTIIVEATQAGLPLIEKMLKKAQPQVIHLVSFLKPYALKSLSLSAPLINKATPIAEKYWGKVVTVSCICVIFLPLFRSLLTHYSVGY